MHITVVASEIPTNRLLLQLVRADVAPEKDTIEAKVYCTIQDGNLVKYEGNLDVPKNFGEIGAVLVNNESPNEIFIKNIVLNGGSDTISCNSWVASKVERIFFTDKCYLPSQTPEGLKGLREKELQNLQGNGEGERKSPERVYDYDKYNDIGNPDESNELKRPILGGTEYPYPRRCRTGRGPSEKDPLSEKSSSGDLYVPRDEAFLKKKQATFMDTSATSKFGDKSATLPSVERALIDASLGFSSFKHVDSLFNEGIILPKDLVNQGTLLKRLVRPFTEETYVLRFDAPELMTWDKFDGLSDIEFARQTLAGVNPYSIELVKEWPLKSQLDEKIYGPPESAITSEHIERQIRDIMSVEEVTQNPNNSENAEKESKGIMTVEVVVKQKKLFVLDYHDLLLPFVHKVRKLEGTTLYGSRTLFFLTLEGTLRPLAIELTRPPNGNECRWRHVFTPASDSTNDWLWRFAKAHVCAHDSGFHQLVVHWLRTHCCVEPYIIATNRQLSTMHPIYRLLHPHFRYTMKINAISRKILINAGGIIEKSFWSGKYSMELSSVAYKKYWHFDTEALPADLIKRGMAVEDPEGRLKLTIEDYPFAADGILLWNAIKEWVSDYVKQYYPNPELILSDNELEKWWTEIRTKGHEDKKDEPGWPVLETPDELIKVLTTIIWVSSAHHAAVNFGQYTYGSYFPNRPTIMRKKMPNEELSDEDCKNFLKNPETTLLQSFPSQLQAITVMASLDMLSNHSEDEEYIGSKAEPSWDKHLAIKNAFENFSEKLKELENIINSRNKNPNLKNRNGDGIVPYELLKPFSEPGITGMGVPNSISI